MKERCRKCGQEFGESIPTEHGIMVFAIYPNKGKTIPCSGELEEVKE